MENKLFKRQIVVSRTLGESKKKTPWQSADDQIHKR